MATSHARPRDEMATSHARPRDERPWFWTTMGSGEGSRSLSRGGASQSADIAMQFLAGGGRADLLRPESDDHLLLAAYDPITTAEAVEGCRMTAGTG